jgi:uncharacterized protein
MSHLSLVIKATRLCNLRCTYCHDWRDDSNQTMSFKVMANAVVKAFNDKENDSIEFIWHGGEPTLIPISFYEKALYIQSLLRRKNQTVVNLIQSNGTRLTPGWAEFLSSNNFIIGISLDGPPKIHNRYRKYASGAPTYDDITQTIELLKQHSIPFSVLMVVNKETINGGAKEVFDFFLNAGIKNYGLLAVTPFNRPDAFNDFTPRDYVSPKEMNKFLIQIYNIWKQHNDGSIRIRELSTIFQRFHGKSSFCTLEGNCFGQHYLVEPDGQIAHCDLFLGDARYTLGSILEDDFQSLGNNDRLNFLIDENRKVINNMRPCPEFNICNGWCPHEHYLSIRHNPNHSSTCCGLFDLITHIRNNPPDESLLV